MTDRCCTDCQRTKHFTVFYARVHTRYSRCETKSATFIKAQTLNTISVTPYATCCGTWFLPLYLTNGILALQQKLFYMHVDHNATFLSFHSY